VTPTATKEKATVSSELRTLERQREAAYAELQKVKRERGAFDAETEAKRAVLTQRRHSHPEEFEGADQAVKPDTNAAALRDEIRERMAAPNPHQAEYDDALAGFHAEDGKVQAFRRERVGDRLAELEPDHEQAAAAIKEGFELLRRGLELERVVVEEFGAIVGDTPGLQRKPGLWGYDGRLDNWYRVTLDALGSDIGGPALTPAGEARIADG
jgi:hypothetical protein